MSLAADNGYYVAGAHLDTPGVGRLARSGSGFHYEAV